jgi:hypothetical protein
MEEARIRSVEDLEIKLQILESSLPDILTPEQITYLHNLTGLIDLHKKYYKQKEELDRLFLSSSYEDKAKYVSILPRFIPLENFLITIHETYPSLLKFTME